MARDIEIQGLDKLQQALRGVNQEFRPYILRTIATKPARKAVMAAKHLQPIGETGQTAGTINVLRPRNHAQTWVEVGYKGRSLGHIYTSGETIVRHKRGTLKGFPTLFKRAGEQVGSVILKELSVDLTSLFVRYMRRRGYRP